MGLCGLEKHPYEISPECVGDSWSAIPRGLDPGVLLWSTFRHTLGFPPSMPWCLQSAGSGQVCGFEEDSKPPFLSLNWADQGSRLLSTSAASNAALPSRVNSRPLACNSAAIGNKTITPAKYLSLV